MRTRLRPSTVLGTTGTAALSLVALLDMGAPARSEDAAAAPTPSVYLDLRTTMSTLPAGAISVGLGGSDMSAVLRTLTALSGRPGASPASQNVVVDFPLTADFDRVSFYGGISASASHNAIAGWSDFDVTSWNVGFQAELYRQDGGAIPTLTWQSTITRSLSTPLAATSTFTNILEAGYALDTDETRGILAGLQTVHVLADTSLVHVNPSIVGYVGGYYQWPNNWKLTARVGIQSFGGAQLLSLPPFSSFTRPVVRLDLDRMDDDDNRLYGLTAQIAWVTKPSYQLVFRTPLSLARN